MGTVYSQLIFLEEGLLRAVITLMQCALISELGRSPGSLDGYPCRQQGGDNTAITSLGPAKLYQR